MTINKDDLSENLITDRIGMWVFLASELLFWAAIFIAFFAYQHSSSEGFNLARLKMSLWSGSINTAVLLTSSFFVAIGYHFYKNNRPKESLYSFIVTIFLGLVFLFIKINEYIQHAHEHLVPGFDFHYEGEDFLGFKMFFIFYFIMTGLHILHLLIGVFVLVFVSLKINKRTYDPIAPSGIEVAGLYWHFVDLVWIFLFPLLYLKEMT